MSYHVECDWCGAWLTYDDDQAQMSVKIYHRKGKSRLDAQWSEETRQTRHFCAPPREDTDRGGRNRAGLVPDDHSDSCYDRAIAAIERTEPSDPGMGMEWRLMPVGARKSLAVEGDKPAQPGREAKLKDRREGERVWEATPAERRESLLLHVLGDDRLILRELVTRMNNELGFAREDGHMPAVYDSHVRRLAERMVRGGQLERVPEPLKTGGGFRYRYFRTRLDPHPDGELGGDELDQEGGKR